ncbi:DUF6491 family protein [Sphingobium sp. H39-3-25]|uniref:DUF6491 family protein n=1 Tax=Sphingobium arseniciresistens TaxID=3030834 RepID=UPI0023B8A6EB|nr:DUF6491 family protein [Sphingobium arseniciresistens]
MRATSLFLLMPFALLAACAAQAVQEPKLTDRQAADLDKALAGKVAGEKTSCIDRFPSTNMRVISNEVLLYEAGRNLTYVNKVIGRCSGLTFGNTLVIRSFGSQYCRGDIASVVDLQTGIDHGACALGDFVPYRTPAAKK